MLVVDHPTRGQRHYFAVGGWQNVVTNPDDPACVEACKRISGWGITYRPYSFVAYRTDAGLFVSGSRSLIEVRLDGPHARGEVLAMLTAEKRHQT